MTWGLLGAFAASVAYGAAAILQAVGVRRDNTTDTLDTRLLARMLKSASYLLGLLLDMVGFVLSFAALRTLPLFTVQAIVASSLAVTAIFAMILLRTRSARREWAAIGAVTAGLAMLALSASAHHATAVNRLDRILLAISVATVGAGAFIAARRRQHPNSRDGWALGALAGLMYGGAGISARMLRSPHPLWRIVTDPALYALVLAGLLGLLLYAMALQRGSVTVATAAVVVAETVVPALVGVMVLGDRPAHGRTPLAAAGFVLSVAGAVALARYGEAPKPGAPLTADGTADSAVACPS